jgi:hypothetical protein
MQPYRHRGRNKYVESDSSHIISAHKKFRGDGGQQLIASFSTSKAYYSGIVKVCSIYCHIPRISRTKYNSHNIYRRYCERNDYPNSRKLDQGHHPRGTRTSPEDEISAVISHPNLGKRAIAKVTWKRHINNLIRTSLSSYITIVKVCMSILSTIGLYVNVY